MTDANSQDPVPGAVVNLYDLSGNELANTSTDAQGKYSFSALTVGKYLVEVTGQTLRAKNITKTAN